MLSLLFIGFLIGMRHALEADHIAAVATLVSTTNSHKTAIKHGAVWGIGHTLALFAFGSIVILSDAIIPENMAATLEFAVGIMLIILGVDVIRKMLRDKVHFHAHRHSNHQQHFHAHKHQHEKKHYPENHQHSHQKTFPLKTLFIGLMHGMAGSAALIALTLKSIDTPLMGLMYMLLFGLGSIIGMAALSIIIAIPLKHSAKGLTRLNNSMQVIIGSATIILGSTLVYDIGLKLII